MKKLSSVTLILMMAFQWSVSAFNDTQTHWANRFILTLSDVNIIDGYDDGNFRPDEYINVDELLKLILLSIGEKVEQKGGHWANSYISKAFEKDIIWENEFDKFDRPATRGEIVRIIVRALNLNEVSNPQSIIDSISDYYDILNSYKGYVLAAYANGLVTGYEDGSFRYREKTTRAEVAVMINRMLKIKPIEIPSRGNVGDAKSAYYVSADGSDSNDGSVNSPFRSIEKARDTLREVNIPEGGIIVYLKGGVYELTQTLLFGQQDGGTEKSPITYTSYDGETARLTGSKGLEYSLFENISSDMAVKLLSAQARSEVVQIDLKKAGIDDYGQITRRGFLVSAELPTQMELFIDGERMQLGRWPNTGHTEIGEIVRAGRRSKSAMADGAIYKYTDPQPSKWKTDVQNIFVSGVLGPNYAYDYYPIGEINAQNSEIILREGALQQYYSKPFVYYENIFEEIDMPGEYYVDREKGILYLYPPATMNRNSDIRVSMMQDVMIRLEGASNIKFSNLQMDTTRGAVIRSTETSENIRIENCTIRNTGGAGITINNTNNTVIRNNHIYDLGYSGISISGGDYENLISGQNIVENNHIHAVAQIEKSYQPAVMLGYRSVGTIVRNNEIHNTPHAAIIIYGPEHLVEYNNIYDVVRDFHDMDAIYMNVYVYPWERGVVIRQNYIHDFGQREFTEKQMNIAGIRTDNNGSGLTVEENIFYNIGFNNSNQIRGVCAQGTRNIIRNNIFIDTAETYQGPSTYSAGAVFDIEGNANWKAAHQDFQQFVGVYSQKYPEISNFWSEHYASFQKSNIYQDNLVVNINVPLSTLNPGMDASGYRAAKELVNAENNYVVKQDPGFEDYTNKRFTLKADSEVFSKIPGFKTVEFDKMGIPSYVIVGR